MKRWIALLMVLLLLFSTGVTAFGQEKCARAGRGFDTAVRQESAAEPSTEAPSEGGGFTMFHVFLIGCGIVGVLLLIMLIMAVTTKSDLKPGDDEKSTAKKNRGKK